MVVRTLAMNEAWDTLVIRKAARTHPELVAYLLNKAHRMSEEDEDEDELDPRELGDYGLTEGEDEGASGEWAEYGAEPSEYEGGKPGVDAPPPARAFEQSPHIGADTYEANPLMEALRDIILPQSPEGSGGASTPGAGPVAVKPEREVDEKVRPEDDADDEGTIA